MSNASFLAIFFSGMILGIQDLKTRQITAIIFYLNLIAITVFAFLNNLHPIPILIMTIITMVLTWTHPEYPVDEMYFLIVLVVSYLIIKNISNAYLILMPITIAFTSLFFLDDGKKGVKIPMIFVLSFLMSSYSFLHISAKFFNFLAKTV